MQANVASLYQEKTRLLSIVAEESPTDLVFKVYPDDTNVVSAELLQRLHESHISLRLDRTLRLSRPTESVQSEDLAKVLQEISGGTVILIYDEQELDKAFEMQRRLGRKDKNLVPLSKLLERLRRMAALNSRR